MSTISGSITSPPAIRNHTEPENLVTGEMSSGEKNITVGAYKALNDSNVNQTVTVTGIANRVNCTFASKSWATSSGPSSSDTITLAPGQQAVLSVNVNLPPQPIGSDPAPFSFEVNPVWA